MLALHEFSVRYRAGFAKQNPTPQANIEVATEAVREQFEQDLAAQRGRGADLPAPTPEKQHERDEREP